MEERSLKLSTHRYCSRSIVAMVEPVTASLFGVVVLNETLAVLQVVGMGLILLTVTSLSVRSSGPSA